MNAARTLQKTRPGPGSAGRIRGPNLGILINIKGRLPYKDALELADRQNMVLASNKRISRALLTSDSLEFLGEALPCWTGTMVAYVEPGTPFFRSKHYSRNDNAVFYKDPIDGRIYVFPVPERYREMKDTILVSLHPDFTLFPEGKTLVVKASKVFSTSLFPKKEGWYPADRRFGIPRGEKPDFPGSGARYLMRAKSMVGPIVREEGDGNGYSMRTTYLDYPPSCSFGAIVESP